LSYICFNNGSLNTATQVKAPIDGHRPVKKGMAGRSKFF